jgi:MFS family permease
MTAADDLQRTIRQPFACWREIPRTVWALGFVSLLMDLSSEMIHALLPIYLVVGLGASTLTVGVIEGVAESTASIIKVFSGALSDFLGKRKLLAAFGYGLAAFTKPVFPLAPSVGWLIAARFIDRVGKGIRGAPRDALVADVSPSRIRGASFGLRQSLDTVGAFAGPLIAIWIMWVSGDHFVAVFWLAVVPAFLAFCLMIIAVQEPEHPSRLREVRMPLRWSELARIDGAYWWVLAIAAVFTLARFSEGFLVLRAQSAGLSLMLVPAVLVIMNVAYALSAYPVGAISDRMGRVPILIVGLLALLAADLALAFATELTAIVIGAALWGVHMGLTQGLLAALVADSAPVELRGTAYGVYNLITGLALLLASVIAGALWDLTGPQGTFLAGSAFIAVTLMGLVPIRRRLCCNRTSKRNDGYS